MSAGCNDAAAPTAGSGNNTQIVLPVMMIGDSLAALRPPAPLQQRCCNKKAREQEVVKQGKPSHPTSPPPLTYTHAPYTLIIFLAFHVGVPSI